MLTLVWTIVAGAFIGAVAQLVIPGRRTIPRWLTLLLGILGASIGDLLARMFAVEHTNGIDWTRHGMQVAAAVVLILVVSGMWTSDRASRR